MPRKKRRESRPWWRKRGVVRRITITGSLAAAVALVVWIFASFGGGGEGNTTSQDLAKPAPSFTLPTVAGDEVSLADYLGQDVVLLYFNEGVG